MAENTEGSMVRLPPLRIKLRSRGSTNDEATCSCSTATARSTGKKVHWRTHMKERNPEKYAELTKHEQKYKRQRDATLEGERLERERERTRERVRKFRERQRAERAMVKKNNQPKSKSQKAKEKTQQEKWRLEKKKQRETWSAEKRKEYNIKQRATRTKGKLALDCAELKRLAELTTRDSVRALLTKQIQELEVGDKGQADYEKPSGEAGDATDVEPSAAAQPVESEPLPKPTASKTVKVPKLPTKKITTYGFDQSANFVKVYVTLPGAHTVGKDDVITEFTESTFTLKVIKKDYIHEMTVNCLLQPIVVDKCYHKVKTDSVVVFLKKSSDKKWEYLTQTEQKVKQKNKPPAPKSQTSDPSAGIMDLMQQMYNDGDDEMKRSIAKAWTEAREKKGSGMGMGPGMGMDLP